MAKELPFFKFEPGTWENGSIQACSFECQGVFINICSMYWQRLGDLPYKLAVQKICRGNAIALDTLISDGVVKLIKGVICIDFLNEQLAEFENTSAKNTEAAHERWRKHRENAAALRAQSEGNAIREEERRGDEIREEEISGAGKPATPSLDDRKKEFMARVAVHMETYPKAMLREFFDYWTEKNEKGRKMRFEMQKVFDLPKRLAKWHKNETEKNGFKKKGSNIDSLKNHIAERIMRESGA